MAGHFRRYLKFENNGSSIRDYLGCDVFIVREWLQSKFSAEMTWGNYGTVWVVDHLVPIRMFNMNDEADLKICWHYKNLMPLLKEDNGKKAGNVFMMFEILSELKDKDYFFMKLFERVKPEVEKMCGYINKYHEPYKEAV